MAQKSVRIVVGTAGHIDHGKTALVKALTGIDADRLEEEKRRGITIDLGFAHMELPDDAGNIIRFGFIDVPGHEKFVRNMLAGIGGIDMVLLVIAADEGIKPQTHEHFDICRLLGIRRGVVALTKSDKVSGEKLALTRASVEAFVRGSFLEAAPMVAVSAQTGAGLDELKWSLLAEAEKSQARSVNGQFRLPVDRVFTMKGFGTVVTGTMVSGSVRAGDDVEVLPGGKRFRIRGLQVHDQNVARAQAGERTAINLAGAQKTDLARGMTLVAPESMRVTSLVDAQIAFLSAAAPKNGARFHFHNLSAECVATLQRYDASTGFARLRLSGPMLLLPGDRFILRRFSPVTTVGGGEVLDPTPTRATSDAFLSVMSQGDPVERLLARIERRGRQGLQFLQAMAETGWPLTEIERMSAQLETADRAIRAGDILVAREHFQSAMQQVLSVVTRFHEAEPLVAGAGREDVRAAARLSADVFGAVVAQLIREKKLQDAGELVHVAGRNVVFADDESQARKTIEEAFSRAGLRVPALQEVLSGLDLDKARAHKLVTLLLRERVLVKLGNDLVFHVSALDGLRKSIRDHKAKSPTIDVARFKDMTQVSRKYAIPLLEFLDRERVTRRQGDVRVIL